VPFELSRTDKEEPIELVEVSVEWINQKNISFNRMNNVSRHGFAIYIKFLAEANYNNQYNLENIMTIWCA